MNATIRWVLLGALTVVVAAALGLQRQRALLLRDEVGLLREQTPRLAALREENERLKAAAPSAEERARLANECAELEQLRKDGAELRAVLARADEAPMARSQPELRAPDTWRNVGRASPAAALETALWAAAGGDLDALVQTFVFDDAARPRAEAFFARLPEASRRDYRTPERLVALLAARDVPQGGLQLVDEAVRGGGEAVLHVRMQNEKGEQRAGRFMARRLNDGWRLVVPEKAIARYEDMLKAESAGAEMPLAK